MNFNDNMERFAFDLDMLLRKVRIALATVFFVGMTLLLLDFTGTLHPYFGWMAKIQLLPAVLALNVGIVVGLILLTLLCGRIYCSVICPLGIMQDIIAWCGLKAHRNRYTYSKALNGLRYMILIVWIAAMVAGIGSIVALLAPYSNFGRIVSNVLQPFYLLGNNLLAVIVQRIGSDAFDMQTVWLRSLPTFLIAVGMLMLLFVLAWRGGRTYCNTICPVGTVLGLLSRWSWLRVQIDADTCSHCGLCSKNCKASCINVKTSRIDYSRCVACGNCLSRCKCDAIHYGVYKRHKHHVTAKHSVMSDRPMDSSRRNFLIAGSLAIAGASMAQQHQKIDDGLAVIEDKVAPKRQTPIMPPGSLSARHMKRHCTGCQLCVVGCPNQVLRPSTDLLTLMQPVMHYERGYCRMQCTRCSQVCPTGAIKPISRAEKSSIKIGHAVWVKQNCVVLTDGVECGNCAHHCPTAAISMVPIDGANAVSLRVPVVNEAYCVGCGACENSCPAHPFTAIYVEGHEEHQYI